MIEKDNKKDKNLVEFSNKSEKIIIKPSTAYIWLNKLGY